MLGLHNPVIMPQQDPSPGWKTI